MIKPITCDNCHKVVEGLPFNVRWKSKTTRCKTCHHDEKEYRNFEFCSARCMRLWAAKFDGHKHKWKLMTYGGASLDDNGKITSVMTYCEICRENNYHCKDKRLIKQRQKWWSGYGTMSNAIKKDFATKLSEKTGLSIKKLDTTLKKIKKRIDNDNTRHSKKPVHKSKK